jgi:septum formation protein
MLKYLYLWVFFILTRFVPLFSTRISAGFSKSEEQLPSHSFRGFFEKHDLNSPAYFPNRLSCGCVRIRLVVKPFLVLASNSPRRRALLTLGGREFLSRPADVDESILPGEAPGDYVLRLAESKARACAVSASPGQLVLAADTTVVDGSTILGKPADADEAFRMLRRLRGRDHQVYTGLALLKAPDGKLVRDLCVTDVPMREYNDDEIEAYVGTGDPLDKAGAYAIQHAGFHPVDSLHGCYASVMGLPLCHLSRSLAQFGISPKADQVIRCLSEFDYDCPISPAVLRGEKAG